MYLLIALESEYIMLEKYLKQFTFVPLTDYIKNLKNEIIKESLIYEKNDDVELQLELKNNFSIRVVISNFLKDANWVSFYYYQDNINFASIDFMMRKIDLENNRVINHSYFILDGKIVTTFNSGYIYTNNKLVSGWEKTRKVYTKDIVHYLGKDSLANLSCYIDSHDIKILSKKDTENVFKMPSLAVKSK